MKNLVNLVKEILILTDQGMFQQGIQLPFSLGLFQGKPHPSKKLMEHVIEKKYLSIEKEV